MDYELSLDVQGENKVITAEINQERFGVFGKCFSQPKEFVERLCNNSTRTRYRNDSLQHRIGQETVDTVLAALNSLPDVKAWQTFNNSVADVCWKWDVLIEHQNHIYPVQIKSSLIGISECQENFRQHLEDEFIKLNNKYEDIEQKYDEKINRLINRYGDNLNSNHGYIALTENKNQKLENINKLALVYQQAEPLYIWTTRSTESKENLANIFSKLFNTKSNLKLERKRLIKRESHPFLFNTPKIILENNLEPIFNDMKAGRKYIVFTFDISSLTSLKDMRRYSESLLSHSGVICGKSLDFNIYLKKDSCVYMSYIDGMTFRTVNSKQMLHNLCKGERRLSHLLKSTNPLAHHTFSAVLDVFENPLNILEVSGYLSLFVSISNLSIIPGVCDGYTQLLQIVVDKYLYST